MKKYSVCEKKHPGICIASFFKYEEAAEYCRNHSDSSNLYIQIQKIEITNNGANTTTWNIF